jgi:cell division protein FtsL
MALFKSNRNPNREFISTRQEIKETSRFSMNDLIGGGVLSKKVVTRQIPFLVFAAFVILFYISNQYRGENIMSEIMKLEKKVRELRAESVSVEFELQELSKQSQVSKMIFDQNLPLQQAKVPPFKIELDQ